MKPDFMIAGIELHATQGDSQMIRGTNLNLLTNNEKGKSCEPEAHHEGTIEQEDQDAQHRVKGEV